VLHLAFELRRGDFRLELDERIAARVCAIAGSSGSGKTSLLEAVAGLARPTRGRIELDGRLLFDSATGVDLPPEGRQLGYVFQDGALFPHLSVAGNLRYGLRRRRGPGPGWAEVIEVLGLAALLERRVTGLSGGERQRVGLGRALLAAPRLLLLDEPLASLDAELKRRILPFLARSADAFGVPVLVVSHSTRELLELAEHALVLVDGRVVAAGPPAPLFAPSGPAAHLALY
jgi:molybdate transport system ATP-binding protein